ncbi:rifin [Plasmodium falciparum NF54]|uniref:Rifin n=2 Tax=Plasmodium falciparum TaxID=5833 RepID=Q8IK38_PLAF7|nr:rifin [Plasmodium falciparum 3D7]KAF4330823.1 rifin [Plasmodium falciparum NF54]PKC49327.1 rifin [Plasmodium falciparum NF54]CZU00495.1 rifin [Plasmodium falciparum 3D7]|eukprot:XP_001348945.1 rifin [Plasmodium falciparum 3D7]
MKVHYINILLFSLPLNILEHNPWNHYMKPHTYTNRSLCECELYELANYDNDPQMKEVMENFIKQTQQRFHEYDERLQSKRKQYKDKCDKEIQKIILKDKLEKQMAQQLTTLDPNITTEDIPTCVCEKSLADKTEKFCLNCGKTMGGVAPGWGLVSGLGYAGWSHYAATTLVKIATDAGIAEGLKVGLTKVTEIVTQLSSSTEVAIPTIDVLTNLTTGISADNVTLLGIFKTINIGMKGEFDTDTYALFSTWVQNIATTPKSYMGRYLTEAEEVTKAFADAQTRVLTQAGNVTSNLTTGITVSIIAIVVIVLVMLIIYLILRYRRKKKMKKKLQYIKLLKE